MWKKIEMSWIADKTREFVERHKLDEKWDDFLVKHETLDICLIRTKDFIENWVYPAWHLRNALYYRYDLVRMKRISRKIYCDVEERMLHANMELIVHFIEKENQRSTRTGIRTRKGTTSVTSTARTRRTGCSILSTKACS